MISTLVFLRISGAAFAAGPTVDTRLIQDSLAVLSGARPFIDPSGVQRTILERRGNEQRALARTFLRQVYAGLGFVVREEAAGTTRAVNLFAAQRASQGPTLLLSSHLDSVGNAGANDDGSGTVVSLAVAAAYARLAPAGMRVVVAAWDLEEEGFVGSSVHKDLVKTWDIRAAISMDMVGRNFEAPLDLEVAHCDKPGSPQIFEVLTRVMAQTQNPLRPSHVCRGLSDHVMLWAVGIPTIHLQGGRASFDPCYHEVCDTIANVDFAYMTHVGNAVLATLLEINAQAQRQRRR